MKKTVIILGIVCLFSFSFSQTIQCQAGVVGADLVDALAYVNGGGPADVLELVTDGGF